MPKSKVRFVCQECGHSSPRWLGNCPACGNWNTFAEEMETLPSANNYSPVSHTNPVKISEIKAAESPRTSTAIAELDRVLGGGIVQGSLVLIGGDPGIGKSTLLLQTGNNFAKNNGKVLYVSGEESKEQIKMRATRLGVVSEELYVIAETNLEVIEHFIKDMQPGFVIIDSIQTVFLPSLSSAPGSVTQVRECTNRLMYIAKNLNITVFIVGHVTKAGSLAGPRVLEHMVDTVLYFEGSRHQSFRILRAVKNRFGSTNEIGVFEMVEEGLREVENPSRLFLAERPIGSSGSVVTATLEGTRPVLIEIQALVSDSPFGTPRRLTTGLELNRALLIVAVLEKRMGMLLGNQDIYLNAVGGMKVNEPAVDLGICACIASSFRDIPAPSDTLLAGEVGLAGEVRAVAQIEKRIKEAEKMGFSRFILPQKSLNSVLATSSMELIGVKTVEEALEIVLGG
ncbi:MAG: hypothetical protein PWQ96_2339 [Clostridia bacterium]|nr:hypothetical protein [Clostridia bacterium]